MSKEQRFLDLRVFKIYSLAGFTALRENLENQDNLENLKNQGNSGKLRNFLENHNTQKKLGKNF